MSGSNRLKGRLVLDSSVLIEMAYATELGEIMRSTFEMETPEAYTTQLALTETFYVLCRKLGAAIAQKMIEALLESKYLTPATKGELASVAGRIKCDRTISLADSYVIAAAQMESATAVFSRRERELQNEISKKPFDIDILFLEDLMPKR